MITLVSWTCSTGMVINSGVLGFFFASFGPTHAEIGVHITTSKFFNVGYGYTGVVCGVGWLLGAPAAGQSRHKFVNLC